MGLIKHYFFVEARNIDESRSGLHLNVVLVLQDSQTVREAGGPHVINQSIVPWTHTPGHANYVCRTFTRTESIIKNPILNVGVRARRTSHPVYVC